MLYFISPIELPFNLVLIVIGTFLCTSLAAFLLFNSAPRKLTNVLLASIVGCISTYVIPAFLFRFDLLESAAHFLGISRHALFLFGPLAYFYTRSCTQQGFQWRTVYFLHFIPFLVYVIFDLPFLLQTGAEKILYYNELTTTGNLFTAKWVIIIAPIHAYSYYAVAARLAIKYRDHVSNSASSIDETYHRWILLSLGTLGLALSGLAVFVFVDVDQDILIKILFFSFLTFLLSIYFAALFKPQIFHQFPHQMPIPDSSLDKKQKYESSTLTEAQKADYIEELQHYIKKNKPYLEPDLTLAQLAKNLDIPSHYLSQVINEKLDQNFLDYINGYRVQDSMVKLIDPKNDNYTIVSVAYESGFNSKSTFYTAFKKVSGMTPSQYRKSKIVTA